MKITDYHAAYYAQELTRRAPSNSHEKLASTLSNAQVDLNPHQIEAALFAFKSPLSKGAILADEVGLGKTIEAGLVISQKWAERKRKILLVVPSSLRKQWNQELADKFFIPSLILEAKSFNGLVKGGNLNPFNQEGSKVVIVSYQFARSKASYLKQSGWNLVVLDEAHRLRNVYKPGNKIAKELRDALAAFPKILLTATPLQNSLLELFGLVSFIDDHVFGDIESFRTQFLRVSTEGPDGNETFSDLKERLRTICIRTLRRQVLEYIKYTNRISLTQDYFPTEEESQLYEAMSDYLQKPKLYALPNSQRQLVTLVLRKLLASSSFAIGSTLANIILRLEGLIEQTRTDISGDELGIAGLTEDFEALETIEDEWVDDAEEDEEDDQKRKQKYTAEDLPQMEDEKTELLAIKKLADQVLKNSKATALITALDKGFAMMAEKGAQRKAIIFTESAVTQKFLLEHLSKNGYGGKIVLFNGSNSDDDSKRTYTQWLEKHKDSDRISGSKTADTRAALVDRFRESAEIMIATEAAAEGVNLQFCSLVINFDLPWNPQRIEQRIGRCHRYGQKHDVVVLNFINRNNAADQRVYELLEHKFQLFKGVFGASDEVLGIIESGAGFEKRIAKILQECRSTEEINASFDKFREEMDESIQAGLRDTRKKLLENFDSEVHERLRLSKVASEEYLETYERWLWDVTRYFLGENAEYANTGYSFTLKRNPFSDAPEIDAGPYRIGKNVDDAHVYRPGHKLAQLILADIKAKVLEATHLSFDYSGDGRKTAVLEPLKGKSGSLRVSHLSVDSLEGEDHILVSACVDGEIIESDIAKKLFALAASASSAQRIDSEILGAQEEAARATILATISERDSSIVDEESEKLDKWAEDRRGNLKHAIKELDDEIKLSKKVARQAANLPDKLAQQKKTRSLEKKRDDMFLDYKKAAEEIEKSRDSLIETVENRMKQDIRLTHMFDISFQVI